MAGTLLYVAFWHPGGAGSGVHRTLKLAGRLASAGRDVVVLCGPGPEALPQDAPRPFRVVSVWSPFPRPGRPGRSARAGEEPDPGPPQPPSRLRALLRQIAFFPDPQVYWIPWALAAARRVHSATPIAAVLCSAPPFSVFILGRLLASFLRVPLVLDYRDVWLDHPWWPVPGWRRGLDAWLERRLHAAAGLVIANHESMKRMLLERDPTIAGRCVVIPNGFDREELGPPVQPRWRTGGRFEILYAGTLYGPVGNHAPGKDEMSVQRPAGFLTALRTLHERGVFGSGGVRVTFAGAAPSTSEAARLAACARECGVSGLVEILPRLAKQQIVPLLRRAHLLLNILYDTEAQVAQKVYEYLHLEIPVLSLLRQSEVNADLIRRARAGPVLDPADSAAIVDAIERILGDYAASRSPIQSDRGFIDQFDVGRQAALLGDRLDAVLAGGRPR